MLRTCNCSQLFSLNEGKKWFKFCLAMVCLIVAAVSGPVFSSSIPQPSDEYLVTNADSVCIGTVQALNPVWVEDQSGRHIITEVPIQVEETLKGSLPNLVTAAFIGGFRDGVGEVAGHAASFRSGERVLVFLAAPNKGGRRHVVEMVQGKFSIVSDTATGTEVVVRGDGSSLDSVDGRISFIKSSSQENQPRDLKEFKSTILNLAGKGE